MTAGRPSPHTRLPVARDPAKLAAPHVSFESHQPFLDLYKNPVFALSVLHAEFSTTVSGGVQGWQANIVI